MKYIKTFENSESFVKGDLVKFVTKLGQETGILEIIDIKYANGLKYNKLKNPITGSKYSWILDKSLRHLTDDEKLEYDARKYNII